MASSGLETPKELLKCINICHKVITLCIHRDIQLSNIVWCKIVIIFLSISLNLCFGWSKEPSHRDGSFEYPQHMFWFRNEKTNFLVRTLIWRPDILMHSSIWCDITNPSLFIVHIRGSQVRISILRMYFSH